MNIPAPHFLLFSESRGKQRQGQWRFVLQAADGSATLEANDFEPEVGGERLELLAVVRGLEALDQPSRVTLFTPSRYVNRGIAYGLDEWRGNDWTWESFGEMVPVKNCDLWQRLDRALSFHRIEFRGYRFDGPHLGEFGPAAAGPPPAAQAGTAEPEPVGRFRRGWRRLAETVQDRLERWKLRLAQLGTCFLPKPWIG
ncbi:MAG TPA: RNase H family protein [Pirellulales bacterium]|nr:RNase H family protein [Pirellulales bacterium]